MQQKTIPSLAFIHPDIPQNIGAAMRLCACLGAPMHVIEPTTFAWKYKEFRRSGMDYVTQTTLTRHISWDAFITQTSPARRILIETDGDTSLWDFTFQPTDILMMGSESRGAPPYAYEQADARITIPMVTGVRSMNVVTAAAIALAEAIRQTR